jgi:RNA polymerase sigma factor (sigma-70 family)
MGSMLLHRFRAERLLREEFESLRAGVTRTVAARLRVAGVHFDADDLDACYAAAWHGLYAVMLDGQQIESAAAWLTLVTHRRAIDEHRARRRIECVAIDDRDDSTGTGLVAPSRAFAAAALAAAEQRDLATDLDDRIKIGQLLEALRARLSSREREAATLCYLHGLSRAEAAAQMGISEPRMRKLMEGRGSARPGVCAKLGTLVETIAAGRWCEEQGSLMRGFAYGILDPRGERYRLARTHHTACPSCRAYVLSLRGLAAVLPPVPAMLHLVLGAGAGAGAAVGAAGGAGSGAAAAGAGSGSGAASGAGAGAGATVPAGSGAGAAALSASGAGGAIGAGAAGGGWWLAGGPLGAKLAVGCLIALGVGAGCAALEGHSHSSRFASHGHDARASAKWRGSTASEAAAQQHVALTAVTPAAAAAVQAPAQGTPHPTAAANAERAAREFGPEQAGRREASSAQAAAQTSAAVASTASAGSVSSKASAAAAPTSVSRGGSGASTGASVPAAAREFAPG